MSQTDLENTITTAFAARDKIGPSTKGDVREAVEAALELLDNGEARVAERQPDGTWKVNQWLKQAVLLSFRLNDMSMIPGGPGQATWWDKVPSKFDGWGENRFRAAGFRAVPGCVVRRSAYIAPSVVLMPCFVNVGAHVGERTMIDTWATVGSCAQVGADVHLAGGAGIGGVLEPVNARPVIIEDGAFIGSRAAVTEGVVVGERAVLGPHVSLTASVPIIDVTGSEPVEHRGYVPAGAVVVPGSRPREFPAGTFQLACALIIGWRSEATDLKLSLNETLREYGIGSG